MLHLPQEGPRVLILSKQNQVSQLQEETSRRNLLSCDEAYDRRTESWY